MKKLIGLLVLALVLMIGAPVAAMPTDDIVDIALGNPDFSILVEALQAADLVDDLQGAGPFTVFAPTNDAFAALLGDLGITKEQLLAHPQLADVLLYHVVSGKVMSTDLSDGLEATTLQTEKLTFMVTGGAMVNDSKIDPADLEATNGVIHVIDKVLVPAAFDLDAPTQSIVEIALGNPDFSTLVAALQAADLVGALQGDGPFTVFAPTNAAFADLLAALGVSAEELLAQPDLAKVLLYHVISGKVMSTDLSDGLEVATLNGESVTFSIGDGAMVNDSNITAVDIEATNGVIHVIDAVLVPTNFTLQEVDDDAENPQTGDNLVYLAGMIFLAGAALLVFGRKPARQQQ